MATDRDYYELLGVARDADDADDQEGVPPARAAAASRRLDRARRRGALPRGDRGVRGALELRDARALRPLRARRAALGRLHADALRHRRPQRPLLGVLRRRPLRRRAAGAGARGADVGARSRSSSSTRRAGRRWRCRSTSPSTCATCGGDGVEPGTTPVRVPPLRRHRPAAAGLAQRVRRVRPHAGVPGLPRPRRDRRAPVPDCDGARPHVVERRELEVDVPAGIHDGQRIRLSGEGHAGALGGRAGRRLRPRARQARPAVRARGQRHLLAGRPDDRRRRRSARR